MSRPLEGLRVLDLTRLLPGGYATLLLADLGADVLKIEEPGKGDYIRWMPPFFDGGVAAGHAALNRGKRSMTLNLKHARGREVLLRLARDADVVIESFRPGVMDRLGAGYETLSAENPRVVYCAISGYGQDGPYRDKAGHDINYIGTAGVLGIMGEPGGPPSVPGVQIGDIGGGALMAAVGILAALAERERTGRGRMVDISMLDGAVSWLAMHASSFFATGEVPRRGEMRLSGGMACYRVYPCADGRHLAVGALEPQFWAAFCTAIGLPELIETQLDDSKQAEMIERVTEALSKRTRDEWVAQLGELEACVGPVLSFDETFADPQVAARGMVVDVETPAGTVKGLGNPIRMSGMEPPDGPVPGPPGFGEHTDEALRAAGFSDADIAALRDDGVV